MEALDSDGRLLRNSKNVPAQRDIVQFVRFSDYGQSDIGRLAEEVLREMPDQIVSYMEANHIKPIKNEWTQVDAAV